MKKSSVKKIFALFVLSISLLLLFTSCTQSVEEKDYLIVLNEVGEMGVAYNIVDNTDIVGRWSISIQEKILQNLFSKASHFNLLIGDDVYTFKHNSFDKSLLRVHINEKYTLEEIKNAIIGANLKDNIIVRSSGRTVEYVILKSGDDLFQISAHDYLDAVLTDSDSTPNSAIRDGDGNRMFPEYVVSNEEKIYQVNDLLDAKLLTDNNRVDEALDALEDTPEKIADITPDYIWDGTDYDDYNGIVITDPINISQGVVGYVTHNGEFDGRGISGITVKDVDSGIEVITNERGFFELRVSQQKWVNILFSVGDKSYRPTGDDRPRVYSPNYLTPYVVNRDELILPNISKNIIKFQLTKGGVAVEGVEVILQGKQDGQWLSISATDTAANGVATFDASMVSGEGFPRGVDYRALIKEHIIPVVIPETISGTLEFPEEDPNITTKTLSINLPVPPTPIFTPPLDLILSFKESSEATLTTNATALVNVIRNGVSVIATETSVTAAGTAIIENIVIKEDDEIYVTIIPHTDDATEVAVYTRKFTDDISEGTNIEFEFDLLGGEQKSEKITVTLKTLDNKYLPQGPYKIEIIDPFGNIIYNIPFDLDSDETEYSTTTELRFANSVNYNNLYRAELYHDTTGEFIKDNMISFIQDNVIVDFSIIIDSAVVDFIFGVKSRLTLHSGAASPNYGGINLGKVSKAFVYANILDANKNPISNLSNLSEIEFTNVASNVTRKVNQGTYYVETFGFNMVPTITEESTTLTRIATRTVNLAEPKQVLQKGTLNGLISPYPAGFEDLWVSVYLQENGLLVLEETLAASVSDTGTFTINDIPNGIYTIVLRSKNGEHIGTTIKEDVEIQVGQDKDIVIYTNPLSTQGFTIVTPAGNELQQIAQKVVILDEYAYSQGIHTFEATKLGSQGEQGRWVKGDPYNSTPVPDEAGNVTINPYIINAYNMSPGTYYVKVFPVYDNLYDPQYIQIEYNEHKEIYFASVNRPELTIQTRRLLNNAEVLNVTAFIFDENGDFIQKVNGADSADLHKIRIKLPENTNYSVYLFVNEHFVHYEQIAHGSVPNEIIVRLKRIFHF